MNYIIKYELPNGEIAGYHADSGCSVVDDPKRAKPYSNNTQARIDHQLEVVNENFQFGWNNTPEECGFPEKYKNSPRWKGFPHEQIKAVAEFI